MAGGVCGVRGCERRFYAKGLCNTHYKRERRTGDVQADRRIGEKVAAKKCSVEGCDNVATERGWCHGHYLRYVRLGDVQPERPLSRRVNYTCSVIGCSDPATARGLCEVHKQRRFKTGDVQAHKPIRKVAGNGFVDGHGYFNVPVPSDLRWLTSGETPYPEHRLKMAQLLGRPLLPGESVHHINGVRTDNRTNGPLQNFRSGNLELWSRRQPSGQRVRDKLDWARNFLRDYAPHELLENALF
jgi:hypothetical protein